MKKIKLITSFLFLSATLWAQDSSMSNDTVYATDKVEKKPEFQGGEMEMYKFIQKNIMYPQIEKEANIMGTVYTSFVVDKDGSITDVTVVRGVPDGPGLDAEAVRMIRLMPKWNPGIQYGRAVKCKFNLPIKYSISNGRTPRKKKKKDK